VPDGFFVGGAGSGGGFVLFEQSGAARAGEASVIGTVAGSGLDVYFSQLRLHWYRGIVAENINLGPASSPLGPQLFVDEAEVHFNHQALRHLQWRVDALVIRKGRIATRCPRPRRPRPRNSISRISRRN